MPYRRLLCHVPCCNNRFPHSRRHAHLFLLHDGSETPLMAAIRAGQTSAVALLIERGAPLDGGQVGARISNAADGRLVPSARAKMMARR